MKYTQPYDQPSSPNASYVDANPPSGIQGSIIPGGALEFDQREIVQTILDVGLGAPSNTDLTQLSNAVRFMRTQYLQDTGGTNAISITMSPAAVVWATPLSFFVRVAAVNTSSSVTIAIAGIAGTKPVVRRDNSPLFPADLAVGTVYLMMYDGTSVRVLSFLPSDLPVTKLFAPKNYYVSDPIGSDTLYDGTTPAISGTHGPFKTIKHALDQVTNWNLNGFDFNIFVADGNYYVSTSHVLPFPNGSGNINIIGDEANPPACLVRNIGAGSCFRLSVAATYYIKGFKVQTTADAPGDQACCFSAGQGTINLGNMNFSDSPTAHINPTGVGQINLIDGATHTITGNTPYHWLVSAGGRGTTLPSYGNVVIANVVTMTTFAICFENGMLRIPYSSITNPNNVIGKRYDAFLNGIIYANDPTGIRLPGNIAGTLETGGQYA